MKNIWKKIIDPKHVFVIAEAGVNHNGSVATAIKLIDIAVEAGVDAVKFQTFKADKLVTPQAPKAKYQLKTTKVNESQFEMLRQLELSPKDHQILYKYCTHKEITFMSTPFDEKSADFLDHLGVEVFKISSGEITNLPFLKYVAKKNKPLIVSTGMSYLSEVTKAVNAIKNAQNKNLVLLHCVSSYPTDPKDVNLRAMDSLAKKFQVPIGFSDHTLGIEIALAAVARGAKVIEKHFTLSRKLKGPDHKASLEPQELQAMILGIRKVEIALGDGDKKPQENEMEIAKVARKSLVAAKNIPAGTVLSEELISIKRPGTGLPPDMRDRLLGKKVKTTIPKGNLITLDMII